MCQQWHTWAGEMSAATDLLNRITNTQTLFDVCAGLTSDPGAILVNYLPNWITSPLTAGGGTTATDGQISLLWHDLEGAVITQVSAIPGISTTTFVEEGIKESYSIYAATKANWASTVYPILNANGSWTSAVLTAIGTYVDSDPANVVYVPSNGKLTYNNATGYGYFLLGDGSPVAFGAIFASVKGGSGCDQQTPTEFVAEAEVNQPATNSDIAPSNAASTSDEPIDLYTGRYLYNNTDLVVGSQPAPYSLSFSRHYNSALATHANVVGAGWSHNYNITAVANKDGFIGFGEQMVLAATPAIAALYVAQDLLGNSLPFAAVNFLTTVVVNEWMVEQIVSNTVVVRFGNEFQIFAQLADGSYVPPLGVKTGTVLTEVSSAYKYTTPDGIAYNFNTSGFITSIVYPFGVTVTIGYNSSGQLTTISNGLGRSLTLAYNSSNGSLETVTDNNSRTITFTPDAVFNLSQVKDALGNVTKYGYVSQGMMTSVTKPANPSNAVVTNTYDTLNRVETQTDAYGNVWNYYFGFARSEENDPNSDSHVLYFDTHGYVVRDIDALGDQTTTAFDGLERPTLVTLPEGNSQAFTYDLFSNVLSITAQPKPGSSLVSITNLFTYNPTWNKVATAQDGNGNVTTYSYVPTSSRLLTVDYPQVNSQTPTVTLTYNARGQLLTFTDQTSILTKFTYSTSNETLLTQVVDSGSAPHLNLTTTFTYDGPGNVASIKDPNGNTTAFVYDSNRRLTKRTEAAPFSYVSNYAYDANNNPTSAQSQTGTTPAEQAYTATYTYDDKVATIVDPLSYETQLFYDTIRRLQKSIDAQSNTYTYAYDSLSRIYQVTDPTNTISDTRTYSNNGFLASIEDANGNITQFTRDGYDRANETIYADSSFEENQLYDANGNVTTYATRSGATIGFTYDALNRVVTKSPQSQAEVTYAYDLANRLLSVSVPVVSGDPSTGTFSQAYDTAGRFYQESYSDGKTITNTLDSNGNVTRILYPDSYYVQRVYDQLNRLTKIMLNGSTSSAVTYAYDELSRRSTMTFANGFTATYGYDIDDNLLSLQHLIPNPAETLQFTYGYNKVGQETSRSVTDNTFLWYPSTAGTTSYGTANSVNQYPSVGANSYTYNGNACLANDGNFAYSYDTENHLLSAAGGSVSLSFKYDPRQRQILKTSGSVSTEFVYSGLQRIADYVGGTLTNRYVFGAGLDEPVVVVSAAGSVSYLGADETGSVISSTDSSGNLLSTSTYSPWGESSSVNGTEFGFTGQRLDPETGLYYYKARYYSPTIGRFLQPDPIGYASGSLNLYEYCYSDPVNLSDPLGLTPVGDNSSSSPASSRMLQANAQYNVNVPPTEGTEPDPLSDGFIFAAVDLFGTLLIRGGIALVSGTLGAVASFGRTLALRNGIRSARGAIGGPGSNGVIRLTGKLLGMSQGNVISGSLVVTGKQAQATILTINGSGGALEEAVQGLAALAKQEGAQYLVVTARSPKPVIVRFLTNSRFGGVVQPNGDVIVVHPI
jgi:RHS repeat-associated protein